MTDALVALGVIARPHGVQGGLRVHAYNPRSTLLLEMSEVILRDAAGELRRVEVQSARPGPKAILMELEGCESREGAEALRGTAVCVPRSALPSTEDGEFYFVDLIGLVVTHGGSAMGKVIEVVDYPSADCLRVKLESGVVEVPVLPQWIEAVDLEAGEISVHDISDLPVETNR